MMVVTNALGVAFTATLLSVGDSGATFVFPEDGATNTSDGMDHAPGAIWFAGRTDEALAPVTNERGALPYDTYELEELPCEANEDHVLIRRTVRISRNAVTLDLGTIDDLMELSYGCHRRGINHQAAA